MSVRCGQAPADIELAPKVNSAVLADFRHSYRARVALAILAVAVFAHATITFAQNGNKAEAGLAVWKTAGCADCHGPLANGDREDNDFPIGANLRTTKLDSAALRTTIRCGRIGTGMPAFEDGAYATRECYGRPPGVRPENLQPTPRMLTPDEIDLVIVYLQTRIIGRGEITQEECLSYYDDQPDTCHDYK
jgi:hypothetical protein